MIGNFLVQTLVSNHLYLGYVKSFVNTGMAFDLQGYRGGSYLHNLTHTLSSIAQALTILARIWHHYGVIWCLAEFGEATKSYTEFLHSATGDYIEWKRYCWVWSTKWPAAGFLANTNLYRKLSYSKNYVFPQALFYTNYASSLTQLNEGSSVGLLQVGVSDTNSSQRYYSYQINANETSLAARNYLTTLFLRTGLTSIVKSRRSFIRIVRHLN